MLDPRPLLGSRPYGARRRFLASIAALLATAVFAAGCAGTATRSDSGAGTAVSAGPTGTDSGGSPPADAGNTVAYYAFSGATLDGGTFDGADLAGKPAVLWFWAPWCPTCAGQAPSVADAAADHGDRLTVVGVAGLGDEAAMRDFVDDFELHDFPHVNDADGAVWQLFEITEQSRYVFLDADGRLVHRGWLDSLQFEQQVAALVG
ncbi:redoxin family protein [Solwaraspora sp. WMMB335]|uniref:redoxin family protein n=1 Tax=Solwaraspora sp. WMMB335 TaxID=3404118 RepID=UPI003B930A5F